MIDIRIPVRPKQTAPKSKQAAHVFKHAADGYISRSRHIVLVYNAGGGFKVPARMPKF